MPLVRCLRCRKMFNRQGELRICAECLPDEEADYDKVREAIAANPNLNAEEVAIEAEVDVDVVQRMIDEGLLESQERAAAKPIACGRCGKPAISRSKRLCPECLTKLNAEMALAQKNLKNQAPQGPKGMSVRSAIEQKKRR